MGCEVICGDVRDLPVRGAFHAILCDPPYELGFMGKSWDASGVAYDAEMWRGLLALLHPGGFGMAFASTRGWHRMATAIEDAGARIYPSIFLWATGQSFPKATRVGASGDFCQCACSQPESRQSAEIANARGETKTGAGFQGDCPDHRHLCDGQPLLAQDSAQVAPPSQDDALGHSRVDQRGGAQGEGVANTCPGGDSARPSRLGCQGQTYLPSITCQADDSIQCDTPESTLHASQTALHKTACHKSDKSDSVSDSGSCSSSTSDGSGYQNIPRNGHCVKCGKPIRKVWEGHRYGGQALKNAVEPIIVFQRPYVGKPWECITETGAGSLWIDGARVGTEPIVSNRWDDDMHPFGDGAGNTYTPHVAQGRWPANLVLGHSSLCDANGCHESCAVRALGEQSGECSYNKPGIFATGQAGGIGGNGVYGGSDRHDLSVYGYGDRGSAARFFTQVDWQLEQAEPLFYQAKAGRRERDAGLEEWELRPRFSGGIEGASIPLKGSPMPMNHNPHPTVKPIALARHLATLLLPPPEYAPRRILIPFAGSGSEMIGALLAGWEEVIGIEMDAEYCEIARARIAHWMKQPALELA